MHVALRENFCTFAVDFKGTPRFLLYRVDLRWSWLNIQTNQLMGSWAREKGAKNHIFKLGLKCISISGGYHDFKNLNFKF